MSRRRTIGTDPLEAVLTPFPDAELRPWSGSPVARKGKGAGKGSVPAAPRRAAPSRVRATFHLPGELVEQARDAVVALSGPPVRLTLAALVEAGIRRELERLQKAHHAGKPWPKRRHALVGGRPVKA
jgi:hypothetical protein